MSAPSLLNLTHDQRHTVYHQSAQAFYNGASLATLANDLPEGTWFDSLIGFIARNGNHDQTVELLERLIELPYNDFWVRPLEKAFKIAIKRFRHSPTSIVSLFGKGVNKAPTDNDKLSLVYSLYPLLLSSTKVACVPAYFEAAGKDRGLVEAQLLWIACRGAGPLDSATQIISSVTAASPEKICTILKAARKMTVADLEFFMSHLPSKHQGSLLSTHFAIFGSVARLQDPRSLFNGVLRQMAKSAKEDFWMSLTQDVISLYKNSRLNNFDYLVHTFSVALEGRKRPKSPSGIKKAITLLRTSDLHTILPSLDQVEASLDKIVLTSATAQASSAKVGAHKRKM